MRAIALHPGVVFLQKLGRSGIADVIVANASQSLVRDHFVAQFLVILTVGIFRRFHGERLRGGAHHDPFLDLRIVGDRAEGAFGNIFAQDHRILGVADVYKAAAARQQSLFAFGPHHAQRLAARNRDARKMRVNLHIVDVLLGIQIRESARGKRELGRLVRSVESGDLAERRA